MSNRQCGYKEWRNHKWGNVPFVFNQPKPVCSPTTFSATYAATGSSREKQRNLTEKLGREDGVLSCSRAQFVLWLSPLLTLYTSQQSWNVGSLFLASKVTWCIKARKAQGTISTTTSSNYSFYKLILSPGTAYHILEEVIRQSTGVEIKAAY